MSEKKKDEAKPEKDAAKLKPDNPSATDGLVREFQCDLLLVRQVMVRLKSGKP